MNIKFLPLLWAISFGVQGCREQMAIGLDTPDECARFTHRSDAIAIVNTSTTTWHDVGVKVLFVNSSGNEGVTDELFVGEWKPDERVCVLARRKDSEKIIIELKQGSKSKAFSFYELPPIATPQQEAGTIEHFSDETYLKDAGEEGEYSIFAVRYQLFSPPYSPEQRNLLWERKWRGVEVLAPECKLTSVSRQRVECETSDGSNLTAELAIPLSDEDYIRHETGMTCDVRGKMRGVPGAFRFTSRPCVAEGAPLCLVLKFYEASLECSATRS